VTALLPEYAHWLDRVRATYEAVCYTVGHRLGDPRLAEQVSVQVVAGMIARPGVFRYSGLPYSGRIARLAEARIAEADEGRLATVCTWAQLRESLAAVPPDHQEVLVATCVHGRPAAESARAATLAYLREVAAPGLPPVPDPDDPEG
jgi:hypothetical protein